MHLQQVYVPATQDVHLIRPGIVMEEYLHTSSDPKASVDKKQLFPQRLIIA